MVFDNLKKANDAYELLKNAEENSSSGAGSDTEAMPFQGDAFGTTEDYASDMFGQVMEVSDDEEEDEEDNEEDEDESELVNMVAELELPQEGAPHQEAAVDDDHVPGLMDMSDDKDIDEGAPCQEVEDSDVDDDEGHAQHKCNVNCFIVRDGYGVKPTVRIWYNEKYTSAQAGQPVMHQESRDYVYGATFSGGDNPWAPFNLKKDWEVARWVILWGAGSMAFSELLAIGSVCFNWLSPYNHTMFIHVLYLTGPWSPQFVVQKLRRTQSNY